ncbi:ELMO domain-containing protein 3 [Tyrophagus putrescentiae]|nr:ELMO domain-containing protein 3 [Tyrophagus putrescentiae]
MFGWLIWRRWRMSLTFFVVTPSALVRRLCRAAYDLSLDSRQHYSFAIMAMNISQISLQVLWEGLLRPQREVTLLETFNRFYFGVWAAFHEAWTSGKEGGGKTILDTGYVLKDLRVYVRQNVNKLASGEYVSLFGAASATSSAAAANQRGKYDDDQADNFTNIGNI